MIITISWVPLIYLVTFLSGSDVWWAKATAIIAVLLFALSLGVFFHTIFSEESVFRKAWLETFKVKNNKALKSLIFIQ